MSDVDNQKVKSDDKGEQDTGKSGETEDNTTVSTTDDTQKVNSNKSESKDDQKDTKEKKQSSEQSPRDDTSDAQKDAHKTEKDAHKDDKDANKDDKDTHKDSKDAHKDSKDKQKDSQNEQKENEFESDGRARQKELFREELKKLEESLQREKSKIVRPEIKKYSPFIFNTLQPYYDTSTVRYLLELPVEIEHQFISRETAIGLCDPWVNHRMDTSALPRLSSGSFKAVNRHHEMNKREQKIREREKSRGKKEGSTMLPKFPVVTMDSKDLTTRQLYYNDVPMLRCELRNKYSQNATKKVEEDYQRTKQDIHRMDLDKLDEVHPANRPHMRNAYFAYLTNTPGSKKAINEFMKKEDKSMKRKEGYARSEKVK